MKVKIQDQTFRLRTNLNKVPIAVIDAMQRNINSPRAVVSIWIKADPNLIAQCNINEITALYNIIIDLLSRCSCRIKKKHLKDFNNITVNEYIAIDNILNEAVTPIEASVKIIDVMYIKKFKVTSKYALCFFSYIIDLKQKFYEAHTVKRESEEVHDEFLTAWQWHHVLHEVSNNDILQLREWEQAPMAELLVYLEYLNNKNEWQTRRQR